MLLDSELLVQEASFYGLMSAYLLHVISPPNSSSSLALTGHSAEAIATPRSFPPMMFAALPEYYLDDIGEFLVFLIQYAHFLCKKAADMTCDHFQYTYSTVQYSTQQYTSTTH